MQASILAGVLPGQRVSLQHDALTGLEEEFAGALAETKVDVAFYLGVPGAYRKVTAQVLNRDRETVAFAKIATSPATRELVDKEHRTLLQLAESEALFGRVPSALRAFDWAGSRVLLITGGPDRSGPRRLSSAHVGLCKDFFLPFAERATFGGGTMMARMSETLRNVVPHLPEALSIRLNQAMKRVSEEIGSVRMPLSLCHRDFAPWNTRVGPSGLFVFDWDGAQEGTIPLYDLFHFQAIQAALFDRRDLLPDRSLLHRALDELWPEGHKYLPWLYLTYLLDMTLFYSEAQVAAPGIGEKRVWRWFGGQIETFLERGCRL